MFGSQARGTNGNCPVQRDHLQRQPANGLLDHNYCLRASLKRPYEKLGEGSTGNRQTIIPVMRCRDLSCCGWMMKIIGVQVPDEDAGIEDRQSHSLRRSAR